MGPKLVDYLLYEPEDNGILRIKFNRPDWMNALVGTAEENSTVAKVGEYMRAGDDDPDIRVIVLTGVRRDFCSGANLGSRASAGGLEQDHRRLGAGITGDSPAKVRFARDSLLEESGSDLRGTKSSNPVPSSRGSATNRELRGEN